MRNKAALLLLSSLAMIVIFVPIIRQNEEQKEIESEVTTQHKIISTPEPTQEIKGNSVKKDIVKPIKTKKVIKYHDYWITASVLNVREKADKKSKIIDRLFFNMKIRAAEYDSAWLVLSNGGYVSNEFVSDDKIEYQSFDVPVTNGFKSFMPYNLFSSRSNQRKLQTSCYTGEYGIRKYQERYCVALGSHFQTSIGQYFDLILENGTVIPCIMADQKANCDTDSSNIITVGNGCVTEFVVDFSCLNSTAKRMGDISYCSDDWKSRVVEIRVYKKKADI